MSNNQIVIETLTKKRESLVDERMKAIERFDTLINEIDAAIDIYLGKKSWTTPMTEFYDDERHDYIKSSEEEI